MRLSFAFAAVLCVASVTGDCLPAPACDETPPADVVGFVTPIAPDDALVDGATASLLCAPPDVWTKEECQAQCLLQCTCKAFAFAEYGGPKPTCQLFKNRLGWVTVPENWDDTIMEPVAGAYWYWEWAAGDRDSTPTLPEVTFTLETPRAGDASIFYKESIVIRASMSRPAVRDIVILFSIGGNVRRGVDYWTSFPATNLVKIFPGSTTASWEVSSKLNKNGQEKILTLSMVFVTNASVSGQRSEETATPTHTYTLTGGHPKTKEGEKVKEGEK